MIQYYGRLPNDGLSSIARITLEMYSRGRRGAPAKGVGRLYRRESSNLSISANKKDTQFRVSFLFCAAMQDFELCAEGADNAAKPSRKACFPARRAKLLPRAQILDLRIRASGRMSLTFGLAKEYSSNLNLTHLGAPYFSFVADLAYHHRTNCGVYHQLLRVCISCSCSLTVCTVALRATFRL